MAPHLIQPRKQHRRSLDDERNSIKLHLNILPLLTTLSWFRSPTSHQPLVGPRQQHPTPKPEYLLEGAEQVPLFAEHQQPKMKESTQTGLSNKQ